jgi:superfamily II DNA or RNA helicase
LAFRPTCARPSPTWPAIAADDLIAVREPAAWDARLGPRRPIADLAPAIRLGLAGVAPAPWDPPDWLLAHQRPAARRLATALRVFGTALLCDAVGLGKSFVALALATRYAGFTLVVPAALRAQWRDLAARYGLAPRIVTHEALSRGARVPAAGLLIVDEAHRFRDAGTRRYDTLARQVGRADLLLVTATPVVNRAGDLTSLLRLGLADHALGTLGVPSLEQAGADGAVDALAAAVAPLVVARSPETACPPTPLPDLCGTRVIRAPPVESPLLIRVIRGICGLRFPTFGPDAAPLLSRHLLARLASSPEACQESLRRHRAYLERAREAAGRGERLGRAAARSLFGVDDAGQLELVLAETTPLPAAQRAMERELGRLDAVAALLAAVGPNPKLRACLALLRRRAGRRTIVFTAARATARALASAVGWRGVAVVAGRRAEIASGRLALSDVFRLFAPRAQGVAAPPPLLTVHTLIATDVASEGLNLQDADGVIHYDLPWTPFALEQRVGRARRLGSEHAAVRVWWLAPPEQLDRRLGLTHRILKKASLQVALATPRTTTVGRVDLVGGPLDRRESLLGEIGALARGHSVIDQPMEPFVVVLLRGSRGDVFHLVAPESPGLPVDLVARAFTSGDAAPAPGSAPTVDPGWIAARLRAIRLAADAGPRHLAARSLARRIAARARDAARHRLPRLLPLLDGALQRVLSGLPVGAERELDDLLERAGTAQLAAWCDRWSPRNPELGDPEAIASVWPLASGESSGYIRVNGESRPGPHPG